MRHKSNRRRIIEIVDDVLETAICKGDATKTDNAQDTSYTSSIETICNYLTENELFEFDSDTHPFQVAKRGLGFINACNQVDAAFKKSSIKIVIRKNAPPTPTIF